MGGLGHTLGPADVARVRAAGVSDAAIADALYVCFMLNTINRIANAMDFSWRTDAGRMKLAAELNRIGYHTPKLTLR